MSSSGVLIPVIRSVIVLDSTGNRVAAKYYNITNDPLLSDSSKQFIFEKKLFNKTIRSNTRIEAEILLIEHYLIIYKIVNDITFYIVLENNESELIGHSVLIALDESIQNLLKGNISKKTLIENLDLLLLTLDEIIDNGLVLENDSNLIVSRVYMVGSGDKEVPLTEQTFSQALQTAKDQLVRSFR